LVVLQIGKAKDLPATLRILLGLFFDPEDGGDMFLRDVFFTFINRLHGVISQKIEIFVK
jgi:hypothetical protein